MPLGKLKDLISAGVDKAAEAIGKAFDANFTSKEERDAAKLASIQEVNRHFEELGRQALELEKAYLADVASARALQVAALAQNDLFSKRFLYYLAGFVMVSSVSYGILILYVEIPEGNKRLVEQFADMYLLTGALMVLGFFFGSSKGQDRHQEKEEIKEAARPHV